MRRLAPSSGLHLSIGFLVLLVCQVVVVSVPNEFLVTSEPVFPVILEFPHQAVSVFGFTPILLGLTCMLTVCLYRKGAMEGEKMGVGNHVSFRKFEEAGENHRPAAGC